MYAFTRKQGTVQYRIFVQNLMAEIAFSLDTCHESFNFTFTLFWETSKYHFPVIFSSFLIAQRHSQKNTLLWYMYSAIIITDITLASTVQFLNEILPSLRDLSTFFHLKFKDFLQHEKVSDVNSKCYEGPYLREISRVAGIIKCQMVPTSHKINCILSCVNYIHHSEQAMKATVRVSTQICIYAN